MRTADNHPTVVRTGSPGASFAGNEPDGMVKLHIVTEEQEDHIMPRHAPQIGTWYQDLQSGTIFEVVAIDDTIETQCREGEVGEYDFESWSQMQLIESGGPEDWQDVFDLTVEDYRDTDHAMHPDTGGDPLDRIEPDIICGVDEPLN